ncbi:MAG: hypothetical protein U0792_03765 [Gemmataceae bacterium]
MSDAATGSDADPNPWLVRAWFVFLLWLTSNLLSLVWHAFWPNDTEPHKWVCRRTGSTLIYPSGPRGRDASGPPVKFTLGPGDRNDPETQHDWELVESGYFKLWKPWNWLHDLLLAPKHHPDRLWSIRYGVG